MLRKTLASFMVFLFVVFSIPTFIVYSLHGTFLEPQFYSEKIGEPTYDFTLRTAADNLIQNNPTIRENFTFQQLRTEISDVFTLTLFRKMMSDFSGQLMNLKKSSTEPLIISFALLRESLMTVVNNLTFKIYKKLPICGQNALPEKDENGFPSCIPSGLEYEVAVAPLIKSFENTVYEVIPSDATLNRNPETQFIYNFFSWFDNIQLVFLIILVVILGLIALIIFKPFSSIIRYEATAFTLSGFVGLVMSLILGPFIQQMALRISSVQSNESLQSYLRLLLGFVTTEIQRLSLIFFVLGAGLFLLYLFLKKKVD